MDSEMLDKTIEGNSGYVIFLDDVRIDKYVKSFSVQLFLDGSMGNASIEMVYIPDFYKLTKETSLIETINGVVSEETSKTTETLISVSISSWRSILKMGSKGSDVKELQSLLKALGYTSVGSLDGIFGSLTNSAVRSYQSNNSLGIDGVVGPATRAKLQAAYADIKNSGVTQTIKLSSVKSIIDDGIENMTNIRIFSKNVFTNKYVQIFDGNIRSKNLNRTPNGYSLSMSATDYMSWLNKTIAPVAIPQDKSLTSSDILKWRAQGINTDTVTKVATVKDLNFKGDNLVKVWEKISTNTLKNNGIYSNKEGVAYWDDVLNRVKILGDVNEDLRKAEILDFVVTNSATSASSVYAMMNDLVKSVLLEFYQDRDGAIRIKPPYWSEPILLNHVIDPMMIVNLSESTNWSNYYTRIVVTGGVEEWEQDMDELSKSIVTPVVVFTSDGKTCTSESGTTTSTSSGSSSGSGTVSGEEFLAYAKTFAGCPYKWGGNGPNSFDCSGLVNYVADHFRIPIRKGSTTRPTTYTLMEIGTPISKSELRPGDLVFPSSTHVGIFTRPGYMWAAPYTGSTVREQSISNYYKCVRLNGVYQGGSSSSSSSSSPVGSGDLISPTKLESRYGPSIYDTTQSLIKFSNSNAITGSNKTAYDALLSYAKFMLSFINSAVDVASVQTICMPWIRPGFNVWIDPSGIDKVFYVNGISHQGDANGNVYSTLNLSMGRNRADFVSGKCEMGSLKEGKNDNVFINTMYNVSSDFGKVVSDYGKISTSCRTYYGSSNKTKLQKSATDPYFLSLYGDKDNYKNANSATKAISGTVYSVSVDVSKWRATLRTGSVGNDVKELQQALYAIGYTEVGTADGIFGTKTKSGVVRFQQAHSLEDDGIVGPKTKEALTSACSGNNNVSVSSTTDSSVSVSEYSSKIKTWRSYLQIGNSGSDVRDLQTFLTELGYATIVGSIDGIFGSKTKAAVIKFQSNSGISKDGIVGVITKNKLLEKLTSTVQSSSSSSSDSSSTTTKTSYVEFYGEYSVSEIEAKLNEIYASAPTIVLNRSKKIKKILTDMSEYMNKIYSVIK